MDTENQKLPEIEITYEKALIFFNYVLFAMANKKDSKLIYAMKKVRNNIKPLIESKQEAYEDYATEMASTSKEGNLIPDANGNKSYTIENRKKLDSFVRNQKKELIKVQPYIATIVPELTHEEIDLLEGLVIPDGYENSDK